MIDYLFYRMTEILGIQEIFSRISVQKWDMMIIMPIQLRVQFMKVIYKIV